MSSITEIKKEPVITGSFFPSILFFYGCRNDQHHFLNDQRKHNAQRIDPGHEQGDRQDCKDQKIARGKSPRYNFGGVFRPLGTLF